MSSTLRKSAEENDSQEWHREVVGGYWEEIGQLQFDFLVRYGLEPNHYFLDVGCGSLRGGVHFIRYLQTGHYFGVDKDLKLLEAGKNIELPRYNLTDKAPHLTHMEDFSFGALGTKFHYALAQSVFTHLDLNHIIRCIVNINDVLLPGAQFFATFFENPVGKFCLDPIYHPKAGGHTYFDQDVFHYDFHTFEFACEGTELEVEYIGDWDHPRGQKILVFKKRGKSVSRDARLKDQKPIVITGMHRSGTSLVASLLKQAGINMGERLVPPGRGNPRGFFEDADFCEFHHRLLRTRKRSILVSRDFVFEPTLDERDQAHLLVEQRKNRELWGWKDPRTALFLDFWYRILPNARFLLVYRPPIDVLLSLMRRGEFYNAGLLEGLEAWYAYNLRIQQFYEQHRETSLLCQSYAIVDHFTDFQQLLINKLGLDLQIDISVLDEVYHSKELRRASMPTIVMEILRAVHPESVELYESLNKSADLSCVHTEEQAELVGDALPLSEFASTLNLADNPVLRRGLLFLLLAFVAPDLVENYFADSAEAIRDLEEGKDWLEKEWRKWQQVAKEKDQIIQEKDAWIHELEAGKNWLEEEWRKWQRLAEEKDHTIQEQQTLIQELQGTNGQVSRYSKAIAQAVARLSAKFRLKP
jgi:SAM-dependent methyltransferase